MKSLKIIVRHPLCILVTLISFFCTGQSVIQNDSIPIYLEKAQKLLDEYQYENALNTANAALQGALFNNDDKNLGEIYYIIAKIYSLNQEDTKAEKAYSTSLTYSKSSDNKKLQSDVYDQLANILIKKRKTRKIAIKYYDDAFKLAKRLKDTSRMISPLLNLGEYYIKRDDYVNAYKYLYPARTLTNSKSSKLDLTRLNICLGKYFLNIRRYSRAEGYLKKGIALASKEVGNKKNNQELVCTYHEELATAYETRSLVFVKQRSYKSAYNYLKHYHKNLAKAQKIRKEIELQRATLKFEVDQIEEELKEKEDIEEDNFNKDIRWQISVFLGAVIIFISLAFLISSYRNNIQKKKLNNDLIEKNKELVSAKETAEQVSTLKSQFISTVSHELRTPLYGVIGLTSLLMEHPEEKKKEEYLQSLKFSGDYLLALINDVLQLSKIETNEVKLEKVPFDVRTLIEGIVNSLRSKQKRNNNTVHIDIDSKIDSALLGDSVRLSQILINLIGNALKFTKNGNIWIKISSLDYLDQEFKLRFSIKDDGIGIPKSKQETIFEDFAQVKNQNEEYQGTGLGLAIVKKLIHLHESEIKIISEESVGSEFYFDLRYEKAITEKNEFSAPIEKISIGTTNFNILIVDDNKINQIVTQNILKKKGYTCEVANNGMVAIETLKAKSFDLVLMDINMPEMNGLDATKVIRTFNTHIPIIALTAVEEGEVRDQALSVGMDDVIVKPYDTQQFFQTIVKNISKVKYI